MIAEFDTYLSQRGLLPRTRRAYRGVVTRAGDEPVQWLKELVASRPPVGTVQQARAAIVHLLRFQGVDDAEIKSQLPPGRGRKAAQRDGLSADALAIFFEAAQKERNGAIRAVLLLLPLTGLRISELCSLEMSAVQERDEVTYLAFRGKGDKPRNVPLGTQGLEVLTTWIEKRGAEEGSMFPGRGGPLRPGTVRDACRRIREVYPQLEGLTPHVLRHTYATRMVGAGVDLASLKALLGHESLTTTQRYLHPGVDDLARAVDSVEGL